MTGIGPEQLDWTKGGGLVPAIVQDAVTRQVLMLGHMNQEALKETQNSGFVTFFSRTRQRLWRKGESSGNTLRLASIECDCDNDTLLILAEPAGPVCHTGEASCFGPEDLPGPDWLIRLSETIAARAAEGDPASYTVRLLTEGVERIAQKIGEEGVEVAIAAVTRDDSACAGEIADLIYHVAALMQARGIGWGDVADVLERRRR